MRAMSMTALRAFALVGAAALCSVAPARASTIVRDSRFWIGQERTIGFNVPETYADCTPSGLTDFISTSGVPANWRLIGQVNVGYISTTGFVVTQVIPIDQLGNLNLTINYPPHSAVTVNPGGIIEYHVEPQIEVRDAGGFAATFVGGDPFNAERGIRGVVSQIQLFDQALRFAGIGQRRQLSQPFRR